MKFITQDGLRTWLDRLAPQCDLVAPCDVDGRVLYRPVASSDEILFDYERPELSAKDYLLPATEVLLQIEKQGNEVAKRRCCRTESRSSSASAPVTLTDWWR